MRGGELDGEKVFGLEGELVGLGWELDDMNVVV